MARFPFLATLFCVLTGTADATPLPITAVAPGEQCRTAIAIAERGHGIPPQLLAAIGRVESGRRDPASGVWGAWPWTINAEGQGAYFNTRAEAIAAVEALRARGVRSIDVGCMQVNLMHHPAAFPNLDRAFEPAVNADYAARFLVRLFGQTGDWTKATARYHSANPAQGEPYAGKVASFWPEEQRKAGSMPPPIPPGRVSAFAGPIPPFPTPRPRRVLPLHGMFAGAAPPPPSAIPSQPIQSFAGGIPAPNPGRGLDFYRATPIRFAMPFRLVVGLPPRLFR
ncbi:MAG: lytic transglycosylase domain-containing protein [Acetobacteraceae bacterium]|nr:lytic transglycosylase domain-containing protein [Acetobacteraceae bacterium]